MQAPFIKKAILEVPFLSVDQIFDQEMPFIAAFSADPTFRANIHTWMDFYARSQDALPFYQVEAYRAEVIRQGMTLFMGQMRGALQDLFDRNTDEELAEMFPIPEVTKEVTLAFIAYARYTYAKDHPAFGGRFDFSVDPNTGKVFIYEFNGDTPAMLFESMNLQNLFAAVNEDEEAQLNEMWTTTEGRKLVDENSKVAVVVNTNWPEDLGTSEAIAQLLENSGAQVFLADMTMFQFDSAGDPDRCPFFLTSVPEEDLTHIHIMLPWEEMAQSNPQAILRWREWGDKVKFMEPAWRWIMSHKKFLTLPQLQTYGLRKSHANWDEYGIEHVTLIAPPATGMTRYVEKPQLGRQSASVKIIDATLVVGNAPSVTASRNDNYEGTPMVYQPYVAPGQIDGANFIGCLWMAGDVGASLAFREFDDKILDLENERVILHELV